MSINSFTSLTDTIPVKGLNVGFPGTVSRSGQPLTEARQVLSTTPNSIGFGEAVVLIPDTEGGKWQSVKDYIAGGGDGAGVTANFAGIAQRNVKTNLVFPSAVTPGTQTSGSFAPGEEADVCVLGSISVYVATGAPQAHGQVYIRVANPGVGQAIGDIEAAADGGNTVAMPNAFFRTGYLDANQVAEITIAVRNA